MPLAYLCGHYHNCKWFLSQNTLFICDFNLNFTYSLTGWEGLAIDAYICDDVRLKDLCILPGKYLLADAGYLLWLQLLMPYCGVYYHLAEWAHASKRFISLSLFSFPAFLFFVLRLKNKEELFNLCHALA